MSKIPQELRQNIARNIRACRIRKFPGRGGARLCAEAFGVLPQQWSPWETGKRVPDESRLVRLAEFFEVTVEYLRRDNTTEMMGERESFFADAAVSPAKAHLRKPYPESHQPGSRESFYRLLEWFLASIVNKGLTINIVSEPASPPEAQMKSPERRASVLNEY